MLHRMIGWRVTAAVVALSTLSLGGCADDSLVEVFHFADRLAAGDHRRHVQRHDFDAVDEHRRTTGWSHGETRDDDVSFVWAIGQAAELELDVDDPEIVRWLQLRCWPFSVGPGQQQQVRVSVNGTDLGVVELATGAQAYSLPVESGALAPGENTLSFTFALTRSPTPQEQRPLAAAFDFVALSATPEAAVADDGRRESSAVSADGSDLVQPGSSSLVFSLTLPDRATLEFGATSDNPSTTQAMVTARNETGEETVLWSGEASDNQRADLSRLAGQTVDLVFRARGDSSGSVRWTSPRLMGEVGDADLATNVLVIVVDTLRADHVGVYGRDLHTPNMDALARSGVRFTRAYSPIPITGPSHSSLFTSQLPSMHGVRNNLQTLPDDHVTLAEVLGDAYRRTAALVSLGVIRAPSGLSQGFDEYLDEFGLDWWKTADEVNAQLVPWLEQTKAPFFLWAHYSDPHEPYASPDRAYPKVAVHGDDLERTEVSAESRSVSLPVMVPPGGTDIKISAVASSAPRPIRVRDLRVRNQRVAVTCPSGCDGPAEGRGGADATIRLDNPSRNSVDVQLRFRLDEVAKDFDELSERYRHEAEYFDRKLGDLLSALEQAGRRANTLIILTSDHGEGLGEQGARRSAIRRAAACPSRSQLACRASLREDAGDAGFAHRRAPHDHGSPRDTRRRRSCGEKPGAIDRTGLGSWRTCPDRGRDLQSAGRSKPPGDHRRRLQAHSQR